MDYRQIVRERASQMGIDPNLAEALLHQESGGNPSAVSPKGAYGLMQLMPATARELGVDPRDPLQNIDGGLRYLKQQIDRFGIPGGLAAYNAGPGRFQKAGSFENLPAETQQYVPAIMNRAARIAEQRGEGPVGQPSGQPQPASGPDLGQFMAAYQRATEAGDTAAAQEIAGAMRPRFDQALIKARAADDPKAVNEIRSVRQNLGLAPSFSELGKTLYQQTEGKPFQGSDAEAEDYAKQFAAGFKWNVAKLGKTAIGIDKWTPEAQIAFLETLDKYDTEVADFSGEAIGRAAKEVVTDPTTYLGLGFGKLFTKTGATATEAAIRRGLEKSLAKRIAQSTATKAAASGAAYAGGTNVLEQTAKVDAGGQESVDLGQAAGMAGIGAVTGGVLGKVTDRLTGATAIENLARKAGSREGLQVDAEIIRDLGKLRENPNFRDSPIGAQQLNALSNQAISEAQDAVKKLGAKSIAEMGDDAAKLRKALSEWKITDPESVRGTQIGNAVADAITRAQRLRSLTAEQEAAGGLRKIARGALEVAPIPNSLRLAGRAVLGSSQSRKQVTEGLLSSGNQKAAQRILDTLGPSGVRESMDALRALADNSANLRAAAEATKKVTKPTPLERLIDKARAESDQAINEAFVNSNFAPPENLVALANRLEPAPGVLKDNADILRTIAKVRTETNNTVLDTMAAQQPNVAKLAGMADQAPVPLENGILNTISKARGETDNLFNQGMSGPTAMKNEIKNIASEAKAKNKAAAAAERKAQKEAAQDAQDAQRQQVIDDFIAGKMSEDMRTGTPAFQTMLKYVDADEATIVSALQNYARQNPRRAQTVIDMFTPGKKVNKQQFYTVQNDLQSQFGKRVPEESASGTGQGILSSLDAEGNPIRSLAAYNKSAEARQSLYREAKDAVSKVGLSDKAEKIAKEAISDLQTGSPKNPLETLTKVEERLSKLSPEERAKVEPIIQSLLQRFWQTQQ